MGFKSYQVNACGAGLLHLSDGIPVRFSGPSGLIALWCRAHPEAAGRTWTVGSDEWLAMMLPKGQAHARWLVLEQLDQGRATYARLCSIAGAMQGNVELMFTLEPLIVASPAPELHVRVEATGRRWTEALALEGGAFDSTCAWRWCEPRHKVGCARLTPKE